MADRKPRTAVMFDKQKEIRIPGKKPLQNNPLKYIEENGRKRKNQNYLDESQKKKIKHNKKAKPPTVDPELTGMESMREELPRRQSVLNQLGFDKTPNKKSSKPIIQMRKSTRKESDLTKDHIRGDSWGDKTQKDSALRNNPGMHPRARSKSRESVNESITILPSRNRMQPNIGHMKPTVRSGDWQNSFLKPKERDTRRPRKFKAKKTKVAKNQFKARVNREEKNVEEEFKNSQDERSFSRKRSKRSRLNEENVVDDFFRFEKLDSDQQFQNLHTTIDDKFIVKRACVKGVPINVETFRLRKGKAFVISGYVNGENNRSSQESLFHIRLTIEKMNEKMLCDEMKMLVFEYSKEVFVGEGKKNKFFDLVPIKWKMDNPVFFIVMNGISYQKFKSKNYDWKPVSYSEIKGKIDEIELCWSEKDDDIFGRKKSLRKKTRIKSMEQKREITIKRRERKYMNPDKERLKFDNIMITNGDLERLEPGVFLNDTIIDFYIKYIMKEHKKLDPREHCKCLIFTTSFYPLLLKDADRCAKRVPKKKERVFNKDYIFIPINRDYHWTLIVICFPGDEYSTDNIPASKKRLKKRRVLKKKRDEILPDGEESFENVVHYKDICDENLEEDKDESFYPDEDFWMKSQEVSEVDGKVVDYKVVSMKFQGTELECQIMSIKNKEEIEGIPKCEDEDMKQKCIVFCDSLGYTGYNSVLRNIRKYLELRYAFEFKQEIEDEKMVAKKFSPKEIRCNYSKLDQQNNSSDCGIYVLGYLEHFMKKDNWIKRIPVKNEDMFEDDLESKRKDIVTIVEELGKEWEKQEKVEDDSDDDDDEVELIPPKKKTKKPVLRTNLPPIPKKLNVEKPKVQLPPPPVPIVVPVSIPIVQESEHGTTSSTDGMITSSEVPPENDVSSKEIIF